MTIYDQQRSIINIERVIKLCLEKGVDYYLGEVIRLKRRLKRMKTHRDILINEQIKQELREKMR